MSSLFTREASGHNPRMLKAFRMRNRVSHKYSTYPENWGAFSCSGCGRCISNCPVCVDIRAIVLAEPGRCSLAGEKDQRLRRAGMQLLEALGVRKPLHPGCGRDDPSLIAQVARLLESASSPMDGFALHKLGIDIERSSRVSPRAAERMFSPQEKRWMQQTDLADPFALLWTLREAYAKWTGLGLAGLCRLEARQGKVSFSPANAHQILCSDSRCLAGSLLLEEIDGEMGKLAARLRPWTGDKQAVEIDIALAQGQLQGWIDTQKGRALVVKPGSFNGKDLLLAWIQHLCLSLSSAPGDTLLFDAKQSLRLPRLAVDEARPRLAALVALWTQGMKRPLPFFPSTAWEWLKGIEKDPAKPEEADKAALARFNGGYMVTGEGQDVYVARCFPELDDEVLAQLQGLAREHLTPLHQALEELQ